MIYAVICYAVHDKEIASCDTFNTRTKALDFLEDDVSSNYEELVSSVGEAYVTVERYSSKAKVECKAQGITWTWEIVEIKNVREHEHTH